MASIEKYMTRRGTRYCVRWRDPAGGKYSKAFGRMKDAQSWKTDVESRAQLGSLYQEKPVTFGQFAGLSLKDDRVVVSDDSNGTWFGRYKLKVSAGAYGRRKDSVHHLRRLLPLTFDRITAGIVDDLFSEIGATHPKTARVVSETFKMVTREARTRGQRIVPEALEVKPPRYTPGEKTFLTIQRAERLAGFAVDPQIRNAIRFAVLTGVRQHELLNLQDTDVTLGDRSVVIRKSKTSAGSRTVPLAQQVRAIVQEQRRLRVGGRAGSKFIFPAPRGGRWDKRNFNRSFAAVVKAAGETITFHDLRHSFASLMIAAECHPKMLQTLLGHKSIQITMDTYGHLYEGADQAAIKRLDRFLADAAAPSAPHEGAGEEAV